MTQFLNDKPLRNMPLPDGRDASDLRVAALYAALVQAEVPNINSSMGKYDLLKVYDEYLEQHPDRRSAGKTPFEAERSGFNGIQNQKTEDKPEDEFVRSVQQGPMP